MNAIFYKEWIKTRWYLLLALLSSLAFVGYAILRINRVVLMKGADHLWEVMLSRDAIFVELLTYVPLIIGILLALVQYTPEMYRKCLKLTLHLPYPRLLMINEMLAYGVLALLACFVLNYLVLFLYLQEIMAPELYARILLTACPWYLAGIAAYLFVAWITLEPTWRFRVINTIISALLLQIYFMAPAPEAYNGFLPLLSVFTLIPALFSNISMIRFKEGKQD